MGNPTSERPEVALLWEIDELIDVLNVHPGSNIQFADRPTRMEGENRDAYILRVFQYLTTQTQNVRLVVQIMLHDLKATRDERRSESDRARSPFWLHGDWWEEEGVFPTEIDEDEKWWQGDDGPDCDEAF